MKRVMVALAFLGIACLGWSEPVVDGKVSPNEYTSTKKVIDGAGQLSWSSDGNGGFYLALSAKGKGWAAVGLGSSRMNGAAMYLGFVGEDGKPVFSEQLGKGHSHKTTGKQTVDKSAVSLTKGVTVLEFHIPSTQWTYKGKDLPFIVAYSDSADLVTYHGDNFDSGTLTLQ